MAMNPISIDINDCSIIIMKKPFAKLASQVGTAEYNLLQKVRQDYPDFTVCVRQIKKNTATEHYHGLTYAYMAWYINTYEVEAKRELMMDTLNELLDISRCHSKGKRYSTIKKWFLDQYPAVKQFGMAPMPECVDSDTHTPVALPKVS